MAEAATKLPIQQSAAPTGVEPQARRQKLRQQIGALFDDFRPFDWPLSSKIFSFEIPLISRAEWQVAPAIDLVEKDGAYEISAELPGLDENNVDVTLSNHTLTIKGEKSENKEDKRKDYYLSERRYGSFQRSFQIPEGVDADKINAQFAKGVLTVTLPKTAEAKKAEKKITVKTA
jgi:HSP20 family protein